MRPLIDAVLFAKMLQFNADSVEAYRQHLIDLVANLDQQPAKAAEPPKQDAQRGPGRPIKYGHPAYSEEEFKAIRDYIMDDVRAYPERYRNDQGKPARALHQNQPESELEFLLDNSALLQFGERFQLDPSIVGGVVPQFPPVIVGGVE
jgi:hypothetical protein